MCFVGPGIWQLVIYGYELRALFIVTTMLLAVWQCSLRFVIPPRLADGVSTACANVYLSAYSVLIVSQHYVKEKKDPKHAWEQLRLFGVLLFVGVLYFR